MKKATIIQIIGIVLFLIGLALYIYYGFFPCPYDDYASCGLGRGMVIVTGAWPLMGIGALIFIITLIVSKLRSKKK